MNTYQKLFLLVFIFKISFEKLDDDNVYNDISFLHAQAQNIHVINECYMQLLDILTNTIDIKQINKICSTQLGQLEEKISTQQKVTRHAAMKIQIDQ